MSNPSQQPFSKNSQSCPQDMVKCTCVNVLVFKGGGVRGVIFLTFLTQGVGIRGGLITSKILLPSLPFGRLLLLTSKTLRREATLCPTCPLWTSLGRFCPIAVAFELWTVCEIAQKPGFCKLGWNQGIKMGKTYFGMKMSQIPQK